MHRLDFNRYTIVNFWDSSKLRTVSRADTSEGRWQVVWRAEILGIRDTVTMIPHILRGPPSKTELPRHQFFFQKLFGIIDINGGDSDFGNFDQDPSVQISCSWNRILVQRKVGPEVARGKATVQNNDTQRRSFTSSAQW